MKLLLNIDVSKRIVEAHIDDPGECMPREMRKRMRKVEEWELMREVAKLGFRLIWCSVCLP